MRTGLQGLCGGLCLAAASFYAGYSWQAIQEGAGYRIHRQGEQVSIENILTFERQPLRTGPQGMRIGTDAYLLTQVIHHITAYPQDITQDVSNLSRTLDSLLDAHHIPCRAWALPSLSRSAEKTGMQPSGGP